MRQPGATLTIDNRLYLGRGGTWQDRLYTPTSRRYGGSWRRLVPPVPAALLVQHSSTRFPFLSDYSRNAAPLGYSPAPGEAFGRD
jgi:hypothetical protein